MEKKFKLGQIVFLLTDKDQNPRIVTAITERMEGFIYELSHCLDVSSHYDFEMSSDEDVLTKLS